MTISELNVAINTARDIRDHFDNLVESSEEFHCTLSKQILDDASKTIGKLIEFIVNREL